MRWLKWVVACVTVAGLAAAVPSAAAQALEKKKITIAVGGKTLFYYLPLTIAEQRGYFKDEGLEVEIVDFAGGSKALQAMLGGSADVVSGAYEHTITMQAKGINIASVVLQGRYNGIVLGVRKDKAAAVKGVKDLKGLKVGVTAPGSSTNHFVSNLLTKNGLKPDDVAIVGVGASAGAVAAVKQGSVDAIANLDPVINILETDGDIVTLVDSRTEKGMNEVYGGVYHAGSIYAPVDWIKQHPNTTQAVVNAMVRASLWIARASVDDIAKSVPREYYGDKLALYKSALAKNKEGFSPDGRLSAQGANNVYAVLREFQPGVKKAGAKIDLARTYEASFVERALKKYGK
jgi:NitT/TauT family transport system substrate-binding protein